MVAEWVLIIWTINCGWSCNEDNVREFGSYATKEACEESLLDWTVREEWRGLYSAGDEIKWSHDRSRRGGQCLYRESKAQ